MRMPQTSRHPSETQVEGMRMPRPADIPVRSLDTLPIQTISTKCNLGSPSRKHWVPRIPRGCLSRTPCPEWVWERNKLQSWGAVEFTLTQTRKGVLGFLRGYNWVPFISSRDHGSRTGSYTPADWAGLNKEAFCTTWRYLCAAPKSPVTK